ncbi:T9SS type B sorting domain-containing protein [Flavobacteriaceae sp. LMIT009]
MNKPTLLKIANIILLLLFGLQSYAQNVVPFSPRYDEAIKGDMLLIGNSNIGLHVTDPYHGSGTNDIINAAVNVDIDGDPTTFNSSSADLDVPSADSCYQIVYAGLYWSAVVNGTDPISEIKFKTPGGTYTDITGTEIYFQNASNNDNSNTYVYYHDVTDMLTALPDPEGTYTVANISSLVGPRPNSEGLSAGWSLFIIYEDPVLPAKYITSFDGFTKITSAINETFPVSGFTTIPTGPVRAAFAFSTIEGDQSYTGDYLRLNGTTINATDNAGNIIRPGNNFFNSSVSYIDPVTNTPELFLTRNPNSSNTLGFDAGIINIPNPGNSLIGNGDTSATISLGSNLDIYYYYFSAFAIEIIAPNIVLTKIVEDDMGNDIGGQTVGLDQPLNYIIGFQNNGNDDATNFQIRDVLPINIVYNHPTDLVLPPGVTVASYDPATRELVFDIDDSLVEENDPVYEIRIQVKTVETCSHLVNSCDNLILNQAFATYRGTINPDFVITDDPSVNSNTGCLLTPQATNFLADLDDCTFTEEVVLCGTSVNLTAADGYVNYSWSTSTSGSPEIGTNQTITITDPGTYYVFNTAEAPCQSIVQEFVVELFGADIPNPVIPYADEVVICPNNGKELPNIFLCGANDSRLIETNLAGATSIIWEILDETSCAAVTNQDCANEDDSCVWNQVGTGPDYSADTAGQYRLTINFDGGCFVQFFFNVYTNLLNATVTSSDIICTTPGTITVNDVPSGYEYSLDGTNYQASNVFSVTTPGNYTVYIRQIGIPTNPCVFTIPDVQINERDFSGTVTVTQPLCHGDKGSIQIAANDADPQYSYELHQGATLVNSVGPIVDNTYTFDNLNPGTYTATITTENGCVHIEDVTITEPPLLTVSAAVTTPLTCTDGEITIYPVGGTPPYYYFINGDTNFQTIPVVNVTSAGTYTIEVVDSNNCSATTTIDIDTLPEPDFTVNATDILCSDAGDTGTITVNVTNSNGYTLEYSIDGGTTFFNSPVFIGLADGNYDVVVQYTIGTAVCTTTPQIVTINTNTAISGTAELTSTYTCAATGTITVNNVSGGTPPYMYSIDGVNFQAGNTFTGLTDGTYAISIQDANNCTFITSPVIIDPLNPPTDLTFDHSPIDCSTNTTTVTITGVTGGTGVLEYQIIAPAANTTSYQISNVFSGLEPGTYTFQVRDENDCEYAETYTIDPLPQPTVTVVLTEGLDCTVTPDAVITGTITGVAPFNYSVSTNGGAYVALGATTTPFTYTTATAGTYQFEITDANGCTIESSVVTVNPISPPNISALVQTQPILCNGDSNGAIDITIDTLVGVPPFTINVYNDTTGTDYGTQTSGLPAGSYTITVTDNNSCTATDTITLSEPDAIVIDYTTIDITCTAGGVSQGSIIVNSVTGGTAPYTYHVTGSNGYSNSEFNASGTTSVSFNVVDFGLYQINVIDTNGCSVLEQDVLVASPPTDLDISITPTVDCTIGGQAVVAIGSTLPSSGPFYFAIYQGPGMAYPNPAGAWLPEDFPGSQFATFNGLTPGVTYTFIIYDASTNCHYYETASASIPTNSTLSVSAFSSENITCTGSADGNVTFTVDSVYGTAVNVTYEIFDSLSLQTTGITGSGTVTAGGSLTVSNLGPLPFGNYFVSITETSGPNSGCGIITAPFNITESENLLNLSVSIDQDANCNSNSGVVSAIASDGTAPYRYQITTTATTPLQTDPSWATASIFNVDAGNYYVHVIDAYNCIISSPVAVVPLAPSPVISASVNDQCTTAEGGFEIDVTLDVAGIAPYSYSINGGAFQTLTAPFTISNLFSGTHTVEIQDANGCGNIVSVDILAPLEIIPEVTTMPTCNDDDGQITVTTSDGSGSFTYNISPNPASISLAGNVFSGVPSGTYTVTVTDTVTSCTEEIIIVLAEAIPPTFTTTPSAITCFGDNNGSFEIDIAGYSGTYTYEVFDNGGTSVSGLVNANTSTNPEIVTGMSAGTFTVVITETTSPFCSATGNVIISSPADALTLSATETSNVTCDNNQGTITAIANGGWGDYEYELTGAATITYSSNGTFTGLSAGNYTINARDAGGCIVSTNVTLIEPAPITATFTPNTTNLACFEDQNASITITNVTGGVGTEYTYTLNTISPTTSTSGPQSSNVFNNLGAGTYTVTVSDGSQCLLTSIDIIITEPSPIDANLVATTTQTCLTDASLTLSATGGTGIYEYSNDSSFTTVLGSFTNSINFQVSEGTYQFYVRDANGCISNVSNEITIDPLPSLAINLESQNPTISCTGDNSGSIIATAQGGLGNYIYTLQDTLGNTIPATQNSPGIFTELIAGTYVVYVESGDCNTATAAITITEPSNPLNATYTVSDVTCSGENDGILVINATGGTGIIKYAISPQLDQFFESNVFENLAPDNYTVIVQDVLGCYTTFDFTITDAIPVILSIVPNSLFEETCTGDGNGEFSVDISGGTLPYSVSLDNYDGTYITGASGQTIFDFTGLNGGDHTVYVRDAQGCESEWNITFPNSVNIDPIAEVAYICDNNVMGNTITVNVDETSVDPLDLDYSLDGNPYQTSNIFNNVAPGSHFIEVRHVNGCIQITEVFVVEDLPPVSLILAEGNEAGEIIANAAGGTGIYEFEMNGENYRDINTFLITDSGVYQVLVTDSAGCQAVAQIEIEILDPCIPNYFTPNNDGTNDEWTIGCSDKYPDLEFDIFDRYGRKVGSYKVGQYWDGKYEGKELPTGDYWYVVRPNSNALRKEYVGHFTLYR